jgi:uncharacterized protein YjbI with pentapeptide repeats
LAIPVVLAAAGLWFTAQQDTRQQNIENQRARAERKLAVQRAQDEALQAYLSQMSELMLNRNLLEAKEGDPVYTLAQARTSTAITRLDAAHNRSVVRFLSDAGLTGSLLRGIVLEGADLSGADLLSANLSNANLVSANLRGAILVDSNLSGANLAEANLSGETQFSGANLSEAFLVRADLTNAWLCCNVVLSNANLDGANLSNADLYGADLSNVFLRGADLSNADLREGDLTSANLRDAKLSKALLLDANLATALVRGADLSGANLAYANLANASVGGADMSGADLTDANLRYTSGVTKETLEKQASDLEGASMPTGTGKNITTVFEPAFVLSSADWRISRFPPEKIDEVTLAAKAGRNVLTFTNPSDVFDPSNPSENKELPAPENTEEWVSWFQRHPSLDISEPVSVRVGGLSGKQIDVGASSTREVPLYPGIRAVPYGDWKDRYVIVDVGGETVVINVSAPTYADTFFQKAQKVLDTVEWRGG